MANTDSTQTLPAGPSQNKDKEVVTNYSNVPEDPQADLCPKVKLGNDWLRRGTTPEPSIVSQWDFPSSSPGLRVPWLPLCTWSKSVSSHSQGHSGCACGTIGGWLQASKAKTLQDVDTEVTGGTVREASEKAILFMMVGWAHKVMGGMGFTFQQHALPQKLLLLSWLLLPR